MLKPILLSVGIIVVSMNVNAEQVFRCNTTKYTVIIDSFPNENFLRYRAWNRPKGILTDPDKTVTKRTETVSHLEGRPEECGYFVWRFPGNKGYIYEVEENPIRCRDLSDQSTGKLSLYKNGKLIVNWPCY